MFSFKTIAFALIAAVVGANAESHTVNFNNKCGKGTPMLIQGPNVLSTGKPFTSNGPLISAIAYLQTGPCLFNGEKCTLVETTLRNPTSPGSGSSSDISLIPPHAFNVAAGFNYNNGCSGHADCTSASCPQAFHQPNDTQVQVPCQANNAGLTITFCG
ncbi:hypothetical protein BDN70DRAFT_950401 [Pholiota conissans]|uniref:Glycopeptide n=1 Tax=Pholiota conissans TaxID=109636 RepID=A0A9P5YWB9_9AGAR|nr:hypothetical protein BDN70DRAFT_950401 [Pholiota conissans]